MKSIVRACAFAAFVFAFDGLRSLAFDSVGLNYSSVTVNGVPAPYHVRADRLSVDLAQPAKMGDKLAIVATYTARPVRGIYFIRPDKYYPHLQPEIWSQGEAEDNRRWFPTWDEPNQKTPVETIVTVQKGWTVTANGHLKSHTTTGATTTWDWDAAAVPALSTIETTDSEPGVRNAAWDAVADIKDNAKHAKHKMK
jgi:aminopeptidase N